MNLFLLNLFLAFLVGSIWVTITTIIAERLGSKIGGLIGGMPSTAVVTLFFIGYIQSPETASRATTTLPIFYSLNGLFLIIYAKLIKKGLIISMGVSLITWLILAGFIVLSGYENFTAAILIWIICSVISYLMMEKVMKIKSQKNAKIKYNLMQITGRALLSGSIIAFGVFMAKMGGPILGGAFAVFPALFISTLIITYFSQGPIFSRAMTKTLMVSGMINIVIYSISVRFFYLMAGLIYGTLIALGISLISAIFTYNVIIKKLL